MEIASHHFQPGAENEDETWNKNRLAACCAIGCT